MDFLMKDQKKYFCSDEIDKMLEEKKRQSEEEVEKKDLERLKNNLEHVFDKFSKRK